MGKWFTRKRAIWLSLGVGLAGLLLVAFVAPPVHDIHSPNGVAMNVRVVDSSPQVMYVPITPTQSLDDVRCQLWHADSHNLHKADLCPSGASLATSYLSQLTRSPATLYVGWLPCGSVSAYGESGVSHGFNVEYIASNRTVIIHCYLARAWLSAPGPRGVYAVAPLQLLLVPTSGILPGNLSIVEDDRVEHLLGDQSSESPLGRALIY
jgi:hypothetical protein